MRERVNNKPGREREKTKDLVRERERERFCKKDWERVCECVGKRKKSMWERKGERKGDDD